MRRLRYAGLVVALAAAIHIDWHLARPAHHRLSLAWPQHWIFALVAFAVVGWLIARWWPQTPGRAAAGIVALGALLAQGIEPVLELAVYQHELGYPNDPGRWRTFAICMGVGVPALLAFALRRPRGRGERPVVPAA